MLLPAPLCPKSPMTSPEGNRYTQNVTLQCKSHKCCSMAHRVPSHRHYFTSSSHTGLSVATSFILQARKRRCKENEEENDQGHAANPRLSWNLKCLFFFFFFAFNQYAAKPAVCEEGCTAVPQGVPSWELIPVVKFIISLKKEVHPS